jgi:hypothetical protein
MFLFILSVITVANIFSTERLLNEKSSLDEKIKKLNNFLGGDKSNTVNPDEVVLLSLQLKFYSCQMFCGSRTTEQVSKKEMCI